MLCYITGAMLHNICHVMLYNIMLCYTCVMLCYIRYVMSCHVI